LPRRSSLFSTEKCYRTAGPQDIYKSEEKSCKLIRIIFKIEAAANRYLMKTVKEEEEEALPSCVTGRNTEID
jgi:hypothetical protein